jgi:putative glycosyltransferase (TIGR04372 family)
MPIFRYKRGNPALCRYIRSNDIKIFKLPLVIQHLINMPFAFIRIISLWIKEFTYFSNVTTRICDKLISISDFTVGRESLYGNVEECGDFVSAKINWKSEFSANEKRHLLFYKSRGWLESRLPDLANRKYVCLHVRTGEFHQDYDSGAHRNCTFNNYVRMINHLVCSGYVVVRIGSHRKEWVEIPGVINLDNSARDGGILDIVVIEHCDFYIGGQSGPADVALMFGKRIYAVNVISLSHCAWNRKYSRFLPKRVKLNGQFISVARQIYECIFEIRGGAYTHPGVEFVENNEETLLLGLVEFLEELELNDEQVSLNDLLLYTFRGYIMRNKFWVDGRKDLLQKMRWMSKLHGVEGGICLAALNDSWTNS